LAKTNHTGRLIFVPVIDGEFPVIVGLFITGEED